MLQLLAPHLRIDRVEQLTLARLGELQLDALLLDVDCTLKPYRDEEISAKVAAWLAELRGGGIGLCLVSNGRGARIRRFAQRIELPFVATAMKPFPLGCRRAARKLGFPRSRTAMVGDQFFADVIAARLAGLVSILVRPIRPEEEPWFTRSKRPLERWFLRHVGVAPRRSGDRS
ncbi:MAG: YqeG family HAD IIIA-type phosphatase [Candidatus Nealsonbacteria bacterium]|nr:YqeG family HAD IIIA-type phosphatase [Candidatus Nealsonbacteria bacterium]